MRIAVVDDSGEERGRLSSSVKELLRELRSDGEVDVFVSAEEFLSFLAPERYQIVFLDIFLGGMDGIAAAEKLRRLDRDCLLIFVTTSREHALEGFRVRAFDYLVKPVSREQLRRVLTECLRILPEQEKYLTVRAERTDLRLRLRDILYVVSQDHYLYFHTSRSTVRSYLTFAGLRELLKEEDNFLECNRGVMINMDHVTAMEAGSFRMSDGRSLPVRRSALAEMQQSFSDYLFEKMRGEKRDG